MGGAAAVLTRRRALGLAALLVVLVAYRVSSARLPDFSSGLDVVVHAAIVIPAFAASIWIALPLRKVGTKALLGIAAVSAIAAVTLAFLGAESAANAAKLACYAAVGFWFLTLFEELWWIALVAVLVPWVDIWSVAAGPTEYVVEQQPGLFERIAVGFPNPGETATVNIGPPDIVFFALFLAAADRFALRVAWTWIGMAGLLSGTLVLLWASEDVVGLPALPAICLGFLLPNADLLLRNVREARSRATSPE